MSRIVLRFMCRSRLGRVAGLQKAGGGFTSVRRGLQLSCSADSTESTGLVLGVHAVEEDPYAKLMNLTKAGEEVNKQTNGALAEVLKTTGPSPKRGEFRILYGLHKDFSAIAVVGMGHDCQSYNEEEELDEYKEAVRCSAAVGCRALQDLHIRTIYVESFGHAESAAEGAAMGVWMFQELKNVKNHRMVPKLELHDDCDYTGWQIGLQKAAAQNLARQLCETPANLMTPITFAQSAVEVLCKAGVNVEVKVRQWAKMMEMEAFLAASRGSCEPPIFMEASYYGCDQDVSPILLVGKGVTFDSGGLCLKPGDELKDMRGDMAGAACVVAVCRAVAALQLPINIRALCPLCENLPGSCAMKPGDVLRAKNGKTIIVEDTDFDGRMCLADALAYGSTFNPKFIVDVGTLSKETGGCLGAAATATYSNSDILYEQMRIAGVHTGDRVWRFPLWRHFTEVVSSHPSSDVREENRGAPLRRVEGAPEGGAPCSAAAFLREFVPAVDWIHLDTYGVLTSRDHPPIPYLRPGMSGRPTRTLVEFLAQFACQPPAAEPAKPPSAS